MNKFLVLLKKEAASLINVQTVAPLILIFVMFYFLGNFIGGITKDNNVIVIKDSESDESDASGSQAENLEVSKNSIVGFIDNDNSEYSNIIKESLSSMGILALPSSNNPEEAMRELENYNFYGEEIKISSLIVINPGFEESLKKGDFTAVDVYSAIDSFGILSIASASGSQSAAGMINGIISQRLLSDANISENIYFLSDPVYAQEYTYLNNKTERINATVILGYVTSQLSFVPIILMVIILMASSTLATSMVNEKADKTLETLMTAPISRVSVLLSKVISAGIYAIVYAIVYIFAFRNFNDSMTSGGTFPEEFIKIIENFGITFSAATFMIIGLQLFLSVLCGLAIALIIGMMVDDIKALQSYIMPLMILIMIPYFLSMFVDINTLPLAGKIAVYIIPFTHTFTAASNLFTQNYTLIIVGLVYQTIFVAIMLTIGVKIFNSDKLFTLGQIFSKKSGTSASASAKKKGILNLLKK